MSRRTYVVTGGSRGIGLAIVRAIVQDGGLVAFTYRSDAAGASDVEAEFPDQAFAFQLDLEESEAPQRLADELEARWGKVDGLVNNAGAGMTGLLAMTSDSAWQRTVDGNLGGTFRCCRAVLPMMLRQRRGSIVNMASLGVLLGVAGQAAYNASKAGIVGLTKSLAREVGRRHVRVNAVAPGFVATDMTAGLNEGQVAELRERECLPDGVDAACVAATVQFLLSDSASGITGQCLVVDAGVSA